MNLNIKHNVNTFETSIGGEEIFLTRMESRLLAALGDYKVHSRSDLMIKVWKAVPTNKTRTVDVTIGRLKIKMGKAGKRIRTIHGFGYRLDRV